MWLRTIYHHQLEKHQGKSRSVKANHGKAQRRDESQNGFPCSPMNSIGYGRLANHSIYGFNGWSRCWKIALKVSFCDIWKNVQKFIFWKQKLILKLVVSSTKTKNHTIKTKNHTSIFQSSFALKMSVIRNPDEHKAEFGHFFSCFSSTI